MQWNLNARREVREHLFAIEGNDFTASIGEIVGEESPPNREPVARKRYVDVNLFDLDLQHVTWLGVGNCDRACKNMSAWPAVLHLVVDRCVVGGNVFGCHSTGFEPLIRSAG